MHITAGHTAPYDAAPKYLHTYKMLNLGQVWRSLFSVSFLKTTFLSCHLDTAVLMIKLHIFP